MAANDSKRTEQVKINLTERELLDLKRLAQLDERTVADFIRSNLRVMLYGLAERYEGDLQRHSDPDVVALVKPKRISRRRRQVFGASNGQCTYCATPLTIDGEWHVDHMMPRALGGIDDATNLCVCCAPCNLAKGDRTDIEFRAALAQG